MCQYVTAYWWSEGHNETDGACQRWGNLVSKFSFFSHTTLIMMMWWVMTVKRTFTCEVIWSVKEKCFHCIVEWSSSGEWQVNDWMVRAEACTLREEEEETTMKVNTVRECVACLVLLVEMLYSHVSWEDTVCREWEKRERGKEEKRERGEEGGSAFACKIKEQSIDLSVNQEKCNLHKVKL